MIDAAASDAAPADAMAPDAGAYPCTSDPCRYTSVAEGAAIETLDFEIDGFAGRRIPVRVRYSTDAPGPLPVVLWAHAGSWNDGGHTQGAEWSETFARAGYAVVHWATVLPTVDQVRAMCDGVNLPADAECRDLALDRMEGDEAADNPFNSISIARAQDPIFFLNNLGALAQRIERERGVRLDPTRVAVGGWSGGSQCGVQVAGAARLVADALPPYQVEHPLPKGFLVFSPQSAPGSSFFAEPGGPSSWDAVRGPLLMMTGDGDEKPESDLTGPLRRAVFDLMPPGDKILFYSTLADPAVVHTAYNLGQLDQPSLRPLNAALRDTAVAFLDAYVRENARARAWLDEGHAAEVAGGAADFERK